ncbi:MAG: tetratricopeptide repeat protein [Kofleriaceae bacterium]
MALAAARALAPAVAAVGWEPLAAEHLFLVGTIETIGTDTAAGSETLRQAAALAERVHHDYIAAAVWLQLAQQTAFTDRDATRALEYARYADAASARLNRPPAVEVQLAYARGVALIDHGDLAAGEAELRRGLDLAEAKIATSVGLLVQGLAYAFESDGHYADAVETYRRALAISARDGTLGSPAEVVYRMRLAVNLSNLGQSSAALVEARAAAALADQILPPGHLDRVITYGNLAEVLRAAGLNDEALAAITEARARAAGSERTALYGYLLSIEATIHGDLGHPERGAPLIRRACEIAAFSNGDADPRTMQCRADGAEVLNLAGDHATAKAWLDAALPVLREVLGDDHAQLATAMQALGGARAGLGDPAGAVVAYEDALARMVRADIGPGFVASTQWTLGQALPRRARARAVELVTAAVETWRAAPDGWEPALADAEAWLRTHR